MAGALVVTAGTAFALSSDDGRQTSGVRPTTSEPTVAPTDTSAPQPGPLTADDASRIVTDRFGGTVHEIEREYEHGRVEWKVEVRASDGVEYDVRVDSTTGAITRVDRDDDDDDDDDWRYDDHGGGHDRGDDNHGGDRRGGDDH